MSHSRWMDAERAVMSRWAASAPCVVLAVLIGLGTGDAPAQSVRCGERAAMVDHLRARYGETRISFGVRDEKRVVELYANTRSGSWTVLMTDTAGRSCLMAAGEGFQHPGPETGRPI